MALLRDFWDGGFTLPTGMAPLNGNVCSNTGSVYRVQTDVNGVVSCSCISWLSPKLTKEHKARGEKVPAIAGRWCKHLKGLLNGTLQLKPDVPTVIIATPKPVAPVSEVARPRRRYQ